MIFDTAFTNIDLVNRNRNVKLTYRPVVVSNFRLVFSRSRPTRVISLRKF